MLIFNASFDARKNVDDIRDTFQKVTQQLALLSVNSYSTRTKLMCTRNTGVYETKNFMNELIICKYESLPECEQEIHNEAHKRDMIRSTNNSVVSILVQDRNDKTKFLTVQEVEELDNSEEKSSRQNKRHCFSRE